MNIAMENLQDPETEDGDVDHITPIVTTILQTELKSILETLAVQDSVMQAQIDHCQTQSNELETLIQKTHKIHKNLQEQYDRMELKLKYMQQKSDECSRFLDEMTTSQTTHLQNIENKYKNV